MATSVTLIAGVLAAQATWAGSVAVVPTKLIVVDKTAAAEKAKAVFVAKDAAVTKGSGTDVDQISVEFHMAYSNAGAVGGFVVPAGSAQGWLVNKASVAKFVNKSAPAGPTQVKVAAIKPAKLLKLVAKGLGDTTFDILGAGDPAPGPVATAYCVTNGAEENCHCSRFSGCAYKLIAGGTGAKLVCKSGTGDAGCAALPTTTSTSTSTTSTTSTTLPCPTCEEWSLDPCGVDVCGAGCESSPGCSAALAVDACIDSFFTGVSCCSLGASTCASLTPPSCPAAWNDCQVN